MKMTLPLLMTVLSAHLSAAITEEQREGCHREIRERAASSTYKFFSPIREIDRPQDLVDDPDHLITNIVEMDEMKLLRGRTKDVPWSDTYWPLAAGGIGNRYADADLPELSWKERYDYIMSRPVHTLLASGEENSLAPSEKYELAMGLDNELTTYSWDQGREYFERYGKVEGWMGLCHGWAAASMMIKGPKKKVKLNVQNKEITFFPSDIKALATQLWSVGEFETKFIGGRCQDRKPRVDRFGRYASNDCVDNNPGTWHMVVVNQIGLSKRPFIMDRRSDYEVWNQPVFHYQYSYFNPKTSEPSNDLKGAMVRPGDWDKLKALRDPETTSLVGVQMRVSYIAENHASHEEDQEPILVEVEYRYDLELNEDSEIIGGEWESNVHPDFLWVPVPGARPMTSGNIRADAASGLPDPRFIDKLLKQSAR